MWAHSPAVSAGWSPIVLGMCRATHPTHRHRIRRDIMVRPRRLLALLATCVALATATAAAAQPTPPPIEDQHDRGLRNLRAEQAERPRPRWSRSGSGNATSSQIPTSSATWPPSPQPTRSQPSPSRRLGWLPACCWAWSGAWSAGVPHWPAGQQPPPEDACASLLPPPDPSVHTDLGSAPGKGPDAGSPTHPPYRPCWGRRVPGRPASWALRALLPGGILRGGEAGLCPLGQPKRGRGHRPGGVPAGLPGLGPGRVL
jgi:hypothetical protein